MKRKDIASIVEACDGSPKAIQEAANRILMEETEFKVGETVAVVDEDGSVGGMIGKGKIKSFDEAKGWANVEWPDGRVTQVMSNLLYKTGQ